MLCVQGIFNFIHTTQMSLSFVSIIIVPIFFISLFFGLIVFYRNRVLSAKLRKAEQLLISSHRGEKQDKQEVANTIHDQLQGDLIATKNFLFIYNQLKDDKDKEEVFSNIQSTLDASISNARQLSYTLSPPFLEAGDFVKAVEYYFDILTKSTGKQFLIEKNVASFMLPDEKAYELFRIVEMFCGQSIEKNTATQFTLVLKDQEIELSDNGRPFLLDFENLPSESPFRRLPSRLKVLNAEVKQKSMQNGNIFTLKIINN